MTTSASTPSAAGSPCAATSLERRCIAAHQQGRVPAAVMPARLIPELSERPPRLVPVAEHARNGGVPAAGIVVTEMKTPTSTADLALDSESVPVPATSAGDQREPAGSSTSKSVARGPAMSDGEMRPTARPSRVNRATTTIAVVKPTTNATQERRAIEDWPRTSAMASPASGRTPGRRPSRRRL